MTRRTIKEIFNLNKEDAAYCLSAPDMEYWLRRFIEMLSEVKEELPDIPLKSTVRNITAGYKEHPLKTELQELLKEAGVE